MAGEQGATQQGVPQGEQSSRAQSISNAREEAMAAIFDSRLDAYETESGTKVDRDAAAAATTDVDTDTDDAAAEAARKQLEAQASGEPPKTVAEAAKEDTKAEPKLDADSQIAQQAEGDELILDAATLAKAKVRIKVEGTEELVPASKVLGQYQKNAAADVRLADATRLQREAKEAFEGAVAKANAAGTKTEKVEAQQEVARTAGALDAFRKASDALFEGDAEKAAKLFQDAVAAAVAPQQTGRADSTTQQVDAGKVADEVEQRLTQRSALTKLFEDYPEIKADPDYAAITDKYVALYTQQGKSVAEAIAEAGDTVGEKFRLGKHKTSSGRPMRTEAPTTREQKVTGKQSLEPEVNPGNARVGTTAPVDQTASDIVAEIRASRPGQNV
jgi:hypothetical protein